MEKGIRTYGPDALLDLYLSISFPRAFFMAYLATRLAMLCGVYVRVWWRKGFVGQKYQDGFDFGLDATTKEGLYVVEAQTGPLRWCCSAAVSKRAGWSGWRAALLVGKCETGASLAYV